MPTRNTVIHELHTAADGLELSAVTRRRELLPWLAFRFFHIRFVYNWAWDPDRFDWGPGAIQYRIRREGGFTVGGYRIIAPQRSLSEAMTPALPFFRGMVREEVWDLLGRNLDLVAESSRFVLAAHRLRDRGFVQSMVRLSMRAILWELARLGRPLCIAVVNPFLFSRYRRSGLVQKVIGTRRLPAASVFERRTFGAEVPHHVILINLALSEAQGAEDRLGEGLTRAYLFDGMRDHARPFQEMSADLRKRVQAVWDAVLEVPYEQSPARAPRPSERVAQV